MESALVLVMLKGKSFGNKKITQDMNRPDSGFTNDPGHEKMCLMSYANNKGADQPAHPRSLISAFVVPR